MEVLRTPNERFEGLARYPFAPKYAIVDAENQLRMHYSDIGPKNAPVVLFLHGEPTWSYLYRHMARMVADAGYRAIAPDLIGFGRSDKPSQQSDYSYASHVEWVREFIATLGLERVVLVCHDWGGLVGLRLVAAQPEIFARVVASNTFLPTGDESMPAAFYHWRDLSQKVADLDVGIVVQGGCLDRLPESVVDAYRAPFPDESYKAGVRSFPMLVPDTPDAPGALENRLAWESLAAFKRPVLVAFSDSDPITAGIDKVLTERIAGARDVESVTIKGASHFLQEDRGSELAQAILDFLTDYPIATAKPPEPAAAVDGGKLPTHSAAPSESPVTTESAAPISSDEAVTIPLKTPSKPDEASTQQTPDEPSSDS